MGSYEGGGVSGCGVEVDAEVCGGAWGGVRWAVKVEGCVGCGGSGEVDVCRCVWQWVGL